MTPKSTKTIISEYSDPAIQDILRKLQQMNNKLPTFAESVRFNGDMLDKMKKSLSEIIQENEELKKDREVSKTRVSSLEEEVISVRQSVIEEEYRERANNAIMIGRLTDDNSKVRNNVLCVLKKLEILAERDFECYRVVECYRVEIKIILLI
ncbi:hypothetical protein WA026_016747 [Henosepilachna vigintioctopunctata]|uniref:Uncharacterized protein n=1 Tax=Henosepilachna vigintioctopunctata TaxID=420089 RepID=A0AAW1UZY3_9CUCU